MKTHTCRYKVTTLLVISILIFSMVAPAAAEPIDPPQPDETNMEGAPLLEKPTQQTEVTDTEPSALPTANQLPAITIWYENSLKFGHLGNPQEGIDILGNVNDPDGNIISLTYRLNNGSAVSLSLGPDGRRLEKKGDFNAAIPRSALKNGLNTIVFTATDNTGAVSTKTTSFNYTSGQVWTSPYSIQWGSAGSIHNVAQVVDGLWSLSANGVRPSQVGYDRLIAIGDVNWSNFEVLVPITVHGFYPDPANPSDSGGVGIITRWQGHVGTSQPPDGWTRLGAYGYFSNRLGRLALRLNDSSPATQPFTFAYNRNYLFKMRAETVAQGGRYSFKVWENGKPEPSWGDPAFSSIVNLVDSNNDLLRGSVLLVAHRVDATFGNVTISNLSPQVPLNNKIFLPSVKR